MGPVRCRSYSSTTRGRELVRSYSVVDRFGRRIDGGDRVRSKTVASNSLKRSSATRFPGVLRLQAPA